MRIVNLSRRPFVNRRPVVRLSWLLWVLGGLLLVTNLWFYGTYWRSSAVQRGLLAEQDRRIDSARELLDEKNSALDGLKLRGRNTKASYLNQLIHRRTFPWSALFDDLEDVLPIDVLLQNIKPTVKKAKKRRSSRRTERRRPVTPQQARARAKGENVSTSSGSTAANGTAMPAATRPSGLVTLILQGASRTDDAMLEFVDRLYAHPAFSEPNLTRESESKQSGDIQFSVRVLYHTSKSAERRARQEAGENSGEESPLIADREGDPGEESEGAASFDEGTSSEGGFAGEVAEELGVRPEATTRDFEEEPRARQRPTARERRSNNRRGRSTNGRRRQTSSSSAEEESERAAPRRNRRGQTSTSVGAVPFVQPGTGGGVQPPPNRPGTPRPVTPGRPGSRPGGTPRPPTVTPTASSATKLLGSPRWHRFIDELLFGEALET